MDFNFNQFADVYADLGIPVTALGCIMAETEPLGELSINPSLLHHSDDLQRWWINGKVGADKPHVTLLYGLLPGVERLHVDRVLENRIPERVRIKSIGAFESPYPDEPYYCVHALVDPEYGEPSLLESHARLSLLPHVDTFPDYKPHITLSYIKHDPTILKQVLGHLAYHLEGVLLQVTKLDYGRTLT